LEKKELDSKKNGSHDTTEEASKKQNDILEPLSMQSPNCNRKNKKKLQFINCNNGRWTQEEHQKFLEAILLYGNEWKTVQKHIGTRNSTQARSHAQKFFISFKKKLFNDDVTAINHETTIVNNSVSYEKVSKLFKEYLSKGEEAKIEQDKLVRLLMSLNSVQKKCRVKKEEKCETKEIGKNFGDEDLLKKKEVSFRSAQARK